VNNDAAAPTAATSIPAPGLRISAQEEPARRPGFRPDIEGLRAVAVLLVVLYHCGVGLFTGGYVGVDVFFVISGFLITGHLVREADRTGRLRIGRFYARRAVRLLPAATVVLVATLVASWIWLPPLRLRQIAGDALACVGYVLNVRLIQIGNDYRSAGADPSPLQHFWSLAVEEQFYLAIPLLVLVTAVALRRRAALVAALVVLVATSFAANLYFIEKSSVTAYYGTSSRAWELGAGALLALGAARFGALPAAAARAVRGVGLSAVVGCALLFDDRTTFPGWAATVPVLGTAAVIAAGCAHPARTLGHPVLQFIGARSYSWYLWHWPVLVIAPYLVERQIGSGERLLAALVALLLAGAGFALVEQPLREAGRLRAQPRRAAGLGAGLSALTLALALLAPALPARQSQGEGLATGLALKGTASARQQQLTRRLRAANRNRTLPANLVPALTEAPRDEPEISFNGCFVSVQGAATPQHCSPTAPDRTRRTVVLFGDSHAAQWYPAMQAIARKRNWRLAVFTKVMCTPAQVSLYSEAFSGDYRTCTVWRADAMRRIEKLRPDLVVVSSIADHMDLAASDNDPDSTWADGWAATARALATARTRVVLLADTPAAAGDVPQCLSQYPRKIGACAQRRSRAAGSTQRTRIAEAVGATGAAVVNPTPWFCASGRCPVVVGNTLVYRDDNHITGAYARLLAPLLAERLTRAMPKRRGPQPKRQAGKKSGG